MHAHQAKSFNGFVLIEVTHDDTNVFILKSGHHMIFLTTTITLLVYLNLLKLYFWSICKASQNQAIVLFISHFILMVKIFSCLQFFSRVCKLYIKSMLSIEPAVTIMASYTSNMGKVGHVHHKWGVTDMGIIYFLLGNF